MAPLLALVLLSLAACEQERPPPPKEKPWKYEIWSSNPVYWVKSLKLRGQEVGSVDEKGHAVVEVPDELLLSDKPGSVALVVTTPCGPRDVPLATSTTPIKEKTLRSEARRSSYQPRQLSFMMTIDRNAGAPEPVELWLDTTGAEGKTVKVGSQAIALPKQGEATVIYFPDCPEGRKVMVDATQIGALPDKHAASTDYVIDVGGGHCYLSRVHQYSPGGVLPAPGEPDIRLEGKRVHAIAALDFFLSPAPESVTEMTGKSGVAAPKKRDLVSTGCR